MTVRQRVALGVTPLVATVSAAGAWAAGLPWSEVVVAAACTAAACAGFALVPTGETIRWPAPMTADRTSAGWHEVRILAETLAAAAPDPAARRHLVDRIDTALRRPGRSAGAATAAGRREYERALADLRTGGEP